MFIIFILWYFFHLFCFGWHYDWHHVRSGISSADYQAYLDEYEANASKGKSKLNIWLSQTVPGVREQHRWCRAHAADPAVYNRLLWLIRLTELPALVFGLCFLRAICDHTQLPGWLYICIITYDLILLLLGIRWRRSKN